MPPGESQKRLAEPLISSMDVSMKLPRRFVTPTITLDFPLLSIETPVMPFLVSKAEKR